MRCPSMDPLFKRGRNKKDHCPHMIGSAQNTKNKVQRFELLHGIDAEEGGEDVH